MGVPTSREIMDELFSLSLEQQHQVLRFVRSLKLPAGTEGRSLLRFAGCINPTDLKEMEAAIEDGCERVGDEW